jgi:hypothetical protein
MKKKLLVGLALGVLVVGMAGVADATVLTFDDSSNLGVTLGGSMQYQDDSTGGHLFMNSWGNTDYIFFATGTYVNDFQMNYQPWEGAGNNPSNDSGWPVDIRAYNSTNDLLWSQMVDLTSTAWDWNSWITVTVNTANVSSLSFGPTGGGATENYLPYGYWPSLNDLRIDETGSAPVPEPATMLLMGTGIAGLIAARRKKKA